MKWLARHASNILFAIACVALVGATSVKLGWWRPATVSAYEEGEPAPAIATVDYASATKTILLYVRSDCRFCTASMPFYRRLVTADGVREQRVKVVVISREPPPVVSNYLKEHDLKVHLSVAGTDADISRVRGTPTLVVVGSSGVIEHVWVGRQDDVGEQAILDSISS